MEYGTYWFPYPPAPPGHALLPTDSFGNHDIRNLNAGVNGRYDGRWGGDDDDASLPPGAWHGNFEAYVAYIARCVHLSETF
jgi:hypothetical protein